MMVILLEVGVRADGDVVDLCVGARDGEMLEREPVGGDPADGFVRAQARARRVAGPRASSGRIVGRDDRHANVADRTLLARAPAVRVGAAADQRDPRLVSASCPEPEPPPPHDRADNVASMPATPRILTLNR